MTLSNYDNQSVCIMYNVRSLTNAHCVENENITKKQIKQNRIKRNRNESNQSEWKSNTEKDCMNLSYHFLCSIMFCVCCLSWLSHDWPFLYNSNIIVFNLWGGQTGMCVVRCAFPRTTTTTTTIILHSIFISFPYWLFACFIFLLLCHLQRNIHSSLN